MQVLDKNQQQLENILSENPSWNAIEAWEGLSGLTAGERQVMAANAGGLNDPDTIRTIPLQLHTRRKALFEYIPVVFPSEVLWSLVELLPYERINWEPLPFVMAKLTDIPWQMRRFVEDSTSCYIPPAHPVITTFQEVVGRDPKPEAIRHYLRDWEELNYNQEALRKAVISGMNS